MVDDITAHFVCTKISEYANFASFRDIHTGPQVHRFAGSSAMFTSRKYMCTLKSIFIYIIIYINIDIY